MSSNKIVPNNVPKKYRAKLIRFMEITGGRFGCMYYNPYGLGLWTLVLFKLLSLQIWKMEKFVSQEGENDEPPRATLPLVNSSIQRTD